MLDVIQRLGDALALPNQRIANHILMVVLHPVRTEEDVALLLDLMALPQIQDRAQTVIDKSLLGPGRELIQSVGPQQPAPAGLAAIRGGVAADIPGVDGAFEFEMPSRIEVIGHVGSLPVRSWKPPLFSPLISL